MRRDWVGEEFEKGKGRERSFGRRISQQKSVYSNLRFFVIPKLLNRPSFLQDSYNGDEVDHLVHQMRSKLHHETTSSPSIVQFPRRQENGEGLQRTANYTNQTTTSTTSTRKIMNISEFLQSSCPFSLSFALAFPVASLHIHCILTSKVPLLKMVHRMIGEGGCGKVKSLCTALRGRQSFSLSPRCFDFLCPCVT